MKALAKAVAMQVAVEQVLSHLALHCRGLSREEVLAAALVRTESGKSDDAQPERYLVGGGR